MTIMDDALLIYNSLLPKKVKLGKEWRGSLLDAMMTELGISRSEAIMLFKDCEFRELLIREVKQKQNKEFRKRFNKTYRKFNKI